MLNERYVKNLKESLKTKTQRQIESSIYMLDNIIYNNENKYNDICKECAEIAQEQHIKFNELINGNPTKERQQEIKKEIENNFTRAKEKHQERQNYSKRIEELKEELKITMEFLQNE